MSRKRRRELPGENAVEDGKQEASFESMGLKDDVLRGLFSNGFERPSKIQQRALPAILSGRDVVAQAQSGTGKTAMSAIAAVQLASAASPSAQVLLLAPTRELAQQTLATIERVREHTSLRAIACIGGRSVGSDIAALEKGGAVHIICATPGRAFDLIRRGTLELRKLRLLLVDEADEMLSEGFKEQLYEIYRRVPAEAQLVLVSATMPREVVRMCEQFMTEPERILVSRDRLTLEGIKQFHVAVELEKWKIGVLLDLYQTLTISQCVVFVNTRSKCEWLAKRLRKDAFTAAAVHGELSQSERDAVMGKFRSGAARVLLATDVWSRGIDVANVSLVINFDLPVSNDAYLHRIGRSGRFGRKGLAISFVTQEELPDIRRIERFFRTTIPPLPAKAEEYT